MGAFRSLRGSKGSDRAPPSSVPRGAPHQEKGSTASLTSTRFYRQGSDEAGKGKGDLRSGTPHVGGEHRGSPKTQWGHADVYRLHGSQQSLPEVLGIYPMGITSDVVLYQQARVAHGGGMAYCLPGGPVARKPMAVQDA
jgi:hypothetical protein